MLIENTEQIEDMNITHYFRVFYFCGTILTKLLFLSHFFYDEFSPDA